MRMPLCAWCLEADPSGAVVWSRSLYEEETAQANRWNTILPAIIFLPQKNNFHKKRIPCQNWHEWQKLPEI